MDALGHSPDSGSKIAGWQQPTSFVYIGADLIGGVVE